MKKQILIKAKSIMKKATIILTLAVACQLLQGTTAFATLSVTAPHVTVPTYELIAGKQFTFQGLPVDGARNDVKTAANKYVNIHGVQTFAFTPDGKYVFTTSQCETGTDGKYHTLLSRCTYTTGSSYAVCKNNMVLEGFGHGESITITQRNLSKEVYDIWVACTAVDKLGTEAARLSYRVTSSGDKVDKRVVLRGFEKTNIVDGAATYFAPGGANLSVNRMIIYADQSSNQIAFKINFTGLGKRANYLIYDLKALNALLDRYGKDRKFAMQNSVSLQKANIRSSLCPLDTFQSIGIDGKNLYIAGGHKEIGAQIYKIPYSIAKNGKASETVVQEADTVIDIAPEPLVSSEGGFYDLEIEGLQVKRNGKKTDFYINYYFIGYDLIDKVTVYKFTV